jgi:hypothetical protein
VKAHFYVLAKSSKITIVQKLDPLHMYGNVLDFYIKMRNGGRHKSREKLKFDEGS